MFRLFKKRTLREEVFEKVTLHAHQFTVEQKAAIVLSLLRLAKGGNFLDAKDFHYFERLIELLKIEENSFRFKEVFDAGPGLSITILRKFNDDQKECYVVLLHILMKSRKVTLENAYFTQIREAVDIGKYKGTNIDVYG